MSRKRPTEAQRTLLGHRCPECGARPGEWCYEPGGWAAYIHDARIDRAEGPAARSDEHDRLNLEMTVERFGPVLSPVKPRRRPHA